MISQARLEQIKEFEDKIGYTFNDKSLIDVAFTHSSYTNEAKIKAKSNERLEFLGDSVLDLVVSEVLFKNYNNKPEGWLTKTRSRLVCTDSFAKASEKYDLTSYLNFGKDDTIFNDYKTKLQEYHNAHDKKILRYTLVKQEGPEHDKLFTMQVKVGNKVLATGIGKNKKKAEQDAAKNAYERIKND